MTDNEEVKQTLLHLIYILENAIANEELSLDQPNARSAMLAQLGVVEALIEAMISPGE